MTSMDWDTLLVAARDIVTRSYSPYSHYPVGAAAWTTDGRVLSGCNVENASFGLTLCAECSLVSALAASGGGRLARFTCVNAAGDIITPCGRCRQLLYEFGGSELEILSPLGVVALADMLPQAFGPADMGIAVASEEVSHG
ncbi:MAG: cytidine deaminase [Propionibacteriaceae bacterium]|jgi:cytidine deaminase|nr:cytidine deaminase [Propionibacteriaceae bacterium]